VTQAQVAAAIQAAKRGRSLFSGCLRQRLAPAFAVTVEAQQDHSLLHDYARLKATLARELASDPAADSAALARETLQPPRQQEMLVQAVWHHQMLRADALTTLSGKRVTVLDPGRWNREAGPDFRGARLVIGDEPCHGDVEIHVRASDWDRHRHARDFEYNAVVLHAFLDADDDASHDVLHNGRAIERLHLAPALLADLESLGRSLSADDLGWDPAPHTGACQSTLARLDVGFVRRFFDSAARQRMEHKIARVVEWSAHDSLDQVLYQMILTALGQKSGRVLYYLLARRVPIEELKDILLTVRPANVVAATESVLLHVAGLVRLPDQAAACEGPPADPATQEYLEELARWWSQLAGYYQDRLMTPSRRWYAGIRPASFPERRLAGLARVLGELDFLRGMAPAFSRLVRHSMARNPKTAREWRAEIKALADVFCPAAPSYWRHRFTLGGKAARRPTHLIGPDRGHHLVFNAVLPVLFAYARARHDEPLEDYLWRLHDQFPALETNSISRFMIGRVVAGLPAGTVDTRYERTQQALLHIFYDCCQGETKDCSRCALRGEVGKPGTQPATPA
jgi:hypothetical protein